MRRRLIALLSSAVLSTSFASQISAQQTPRPADPADVSSLDAIIRAYYEVVSGPAGESADRARDETLHLPNALIGVPGANGQLATMTLGDFHDAAGGPRPEGFFEKEIHRVTHRFGNVVQIFSTYESATTPDGEPYTRGINSIQLTWDGDRWWIVSWIFDQERPGNPIPAEYLPR